MSDELTAMSCTPCRGGIPPLTPEEAVGYMPQAPGWELADEGRRLERNFSFKNFRESMDFVARVGALAEREGHHPEIRFGWGWAQVRWQTMKIQGLHVNDFIMAAKTNQLAEG